MRPGKGGTSAKSNEACFGSETAVAAQLGQCVRPSGRSTNERSPAPRLPPLAVVAVAVAVAATARQEKQAGASVEQRLQSFTPSLSPGLCPPTLPPSRTTLCSVPCEVELYAASIMGMMDWQLLHAQA